MPVLGKTQVRAGGEFDRIDAEDLDRRSADRRILIGQGNLEVASQPWEIENHGVTGSVFVAMGADTPVMS